MLSDVCLSLWRLSRTSGRWAACAAGRLDGAYWLIGPGSAGLAQGCRCTLPLQAWVGAYRGGRPPTACSDYFSMHWHYKKPGQTLGLSLTRDPTRPDQVIDPVTRDRKTRFQHCVCQATVCATGLKTDMTYRMTMCTQRPRSWHRGHVSGLVRLKWFIFKKHSGCSHVVLILVAVAACCVRINR